MAELIMGNYLYGQSLAHRLDPRIKITITILFMVSLFLSDSYLGIFWAILCFVFLSKVSDVNLKSVLKGLKPVIIIIFFTFVLNLFLTPGAAVYEFGVINITSEGFFRGFFLAVRLALLIGISVLLTATTSPMRLTAGLEKMLKPLRIFKVPVSELALMINTALRFIPIFIGEAEKIIKVQSSRGINFKSGALSERLKNLTAILIPLFVKSFKRAEDLSIAIEIRCYQVGKERTNLYPLQFTSDDYKASAFILLYFTAVLLIRQIF